MLDLDSFIFRPNLCVEGHKSYYYLKEGSMASPFVTAENIDAILWFATKVLPVCLEIKEFIMIKGENLFWNVQAIMIN